MEIRAIVCDRIEGDGIEILRKSGLKVDVEPTVDRGELLKKIPSYDVMVVRSRTQVTREVIEAGTRLRIIARAGVGLDNVDVRAAESRGVTVLNAPEAASNAVAELTIGLIMTILHKLSSPKPTLAPALRGKTLGIIGLGRIGFIVGHKLKSAFGVKLCVHDPKASSDRLVKLEATNIPLEDLIGRSDIVTIHVPLLPETHHLMDERRISAMKDGAILINTSRGGIVDEAALLKALAGGRLLGAASDVFELEPPRDLRLVRLPNFVGTPHIGAQTAETQAEVSRVIAIKILDALKAS